MEMDGMGGKQRKDCPEFGVSFDMMVSFCYHVPMRMGKMSLARLRKPKYEARLAHSVSLKDLSCRLGGKNPVV
jgi:hypothetical protein